MIDPKVARNAERALITWHRRSGRVLRCRRPAIEAFVFAGVAVERLLAVGVLTILDEEEPYDAQAEPSLDAGTDAAAP